MGDSNMDIENMANLTISEEDSPPIMSNEIREVFSQFVSMNMGDPNMNFENTADLKNEDPPPILSSEISQIFYKIANVLDIKSFMKLALTSKKMYKRCMEDKEIKINVEEDTLHACATLQGTGLKFDLYDIPEKSIDSYIAAIRKLSCNVNLRAVSIFCSVERPPSSAIKDAHRYLKELGVGRVKHLFYYNCQFDDPEPVISFIEEFHVRLLATVPENQRVPLATLRPILQLKLEDLFCDSFVSVDQLLEIDSPIQHIFSLYEAGLSKEELTGFMAKIRSGSLHRLTLKAFFNFKDFDVFPFDYRGPLPDGRPLLLTRISNCPKPPFSEFWFLPNHGPITKCDLNHSQITMKLYKCEPWELPFILRQEEEILKNLKEKRPNVYCAANHFNSFCSSLTMVDPTHQDPLPDDRPLYCKVTENEFWMLDEYDNLMNCKWEDGCATWKPFDSCSDEPMKIGHPALAKYIFWKVVKQVKQVKGYDRFILHCEELEEFKSWFEDFEIVDFEYLDPLPTTGRPVVFEGNSAQPKGSHSLLVFYEDRLVECNFMENRICIQPRRGLYRPAILLTASHVVKMLKNVDLENFQIGIRFETFRDGLVQFKQYLAIHDDRFMVSEEPTDFWYGIGGAIRRAVWKEGRLSISRADLCETPPNFMKQVFKYFAEKSTWEMQRSFNFKLEQLNSCLEQFTIVPFDYSGPLKRDSPLAFVKNRECACSEEYFPVWILWEDMRLTHCVWRNYEPKTLIFTIATVGMPPALKSKEYLKLLLEAEYDKSYRYEWFGSLEEFVDNLKDFVKLPFEYDGPLPDERPLLFENSGYPLYFLLREDGTSIECVYQTTYSISLFSPSLNDVPPALKSMLFRC